MALAYRTIDNATRTAALYVGGAVQLLEVTPERATFLTAQELKVVADLVDLWKAKEVETLGGLLTTSISATDQPPEPPTE